MASLGHPAVGPGLHGEVAFSEIEDAPRGFGAMNAGVLKKVVGQMHGAVRAEQG